MAIITKVAQMPHLCTKGKNALKALLKLGATIVYHEGEGGLFNIIAENGLIDYWEGTEHPEIQPIMKANGLWWEWQNPECGTVFKW